MAKSKNPFKINRQSWDQEKVMNHICTELVNSSMGLRFILEHSEHELPARKTIMQWLAENKELSDQYARAKELQTDFMVEETVEIADDGRNDYMLKQDRTGEEYYATDHEHIKRSDLRVRTRQWVAERLRAKKYGTKTQHSGAIGTVSLDNLTDQELDLKIAQLAKVLSDDD